MNYLNNNYAVYGQININDLNLLKSEGFSVIINNRPDGESLGQPKSDDLKEYAQKIGLKYYHVPVEMGNISNELIKNYKEILDKHAKDKIFAFCGSGKRATILFNLVNN